jgi:hypothetical protein
VTAGNASGVNDGAAAVLLASADAVRRYGLEPLARVGGAAVAGVAPRLMGIGPAPASEKLMGRHKIAIADIDVIELNEAFAAQALAVIRCWGCPTTPSTSIRTAAPSRSAIRWACRAPGSPAPRRSNSRPVRGAARSPPCASASARASPASSRRREA